MLLNAASVEMITEINMESFFTELIIYAHELPVQTKAVAFFLKACEDKTVCAKLAEEGCIPLLVRCMEKHPDQAAFCEEVLKTLAFTLVSDAAIALFATNNGIVATIDAMKKFEESVEVTYRGYFVLWTVCHTQDYCGVALEKGIADVLQYTYGHYMEEERIIGCCIGFCHQMVLYPMIASALATTACLPLVYAVIKRYTKTEDIMDHCVIILTKMLATDLPVTSILDADVLRESVCLFLVYLLQNEKARNVLIRLDLTSFLIHILQSSEKWSLLSAVCKTMEVLCVDDASLSIMEDEEVDALCDKKLHVCHEYPEFIGACSMFLRAYLENHAQKEEEEESESSESSEEGECIDVDEEGDCVEVSEDGLEVSEDDVGGKKDNPTNDMDSKRQRVE